MILVSQRASISLKSFFIFFFFIEHPFLTNPVSQEVESAFLGDEGKNGTELFSSFLEVGKSSSFSWTDGSKRSYIFLFVVFILNVNDRQIFRLSMLTTNVSRLDATNCDLVFDEIVMVALRVKLCCQNIFLFSARWSRRCFSSFLIKPKA